MTKELFASNTRYAAGQYLTRTMDSRDLVGTRSVRPLRFPLRIYLLCLAVFEISHAKSASGSSLAFCLLHTFILD